MEKVRVSLGTASILGLEKVKTDAQPTTAYLMTYAPGRCWASCSFCPQSRSSSSRLDLLSRITWPTYKWDTVIERLKSKEDLFKRVCIQVQFRRDSIETALKYGSILKHELNIPASVSIQPFNEEDIEHAYQAGFERISISIDAATERLFKRHKNLGFKYTWQRQIEFLEKAVSTFGEFKVTSHMIIGLGETEEEAVRTMFKLHSMKVNIALFAFTPVRGTKLQSNPPPSPKKYRRIQILRYLIATNKIKPEDIEYEKGKIKKLKYSKDKLLKYVMTGEVFKTSGCPGCNRPYYNERPGMFIYNYAWDPTAIENLKGFMEAGLNVD